MLPLTVERMDIERIRNDFPILQQTLYRGRPLVYLDNAASSQRPLQVIEAMSDVYQATYANVHRGNHWLSEKCSAMFDQARAVVAGFINAADPREIVFTPGTTAAINLVAHSWGNQHVQAGDEILLTEMEHHSNIVPWQQLATRTGAIVRFAPINAEGILDLQAFQRLITSRTKVVAFSAISNVLGTINPVAELVAMAKKAGAVTLIDAAQHVPHEPTDVRAWGSDFVAFSGHKMVGPSGIGILQGRLELLESMSPFLGGGGMIDRVEWNGFTPGEVPARFEAGTPPIVEAIGLARAIEYLQNVGMRAIQKHGRELASHVYQRMKSDIDGLSLLGPKGDRSGIVSFDVVGVHALDLANRLDLQGVAVRFGHHCAMPLHEKLGLAASCRASFYLYNTMSEADYFVDATVAAVAKLRQ